jgi:hypothetical protein
MKIERKTYKADKLFQCISKIMNKLIPISFFIFSSSAFSSPCKPSSNDDFSMIELKRLIRSEDCKIKSVSDLIEFLPDSMKRSSNLIYRSQSLQGPHRVDFQNPRVILSQQGKEEIIPIPTFRCDDCGHINEEFMPI